MRLFIDYETIDEAAQMINALSLLQTIGTRIDAAVDIMQAQTRAQGRVPNALSPPQSAATQPRTQQSQAVNNRNHPGNHGQNAIQNAIVPTVSHSGREEHIVQVTFPWENVQGQTRLNFEVKNNHLEIRLSRRRR